MTRRPKTAVTRMDRDSALLKKDVDKQKDKDKKQNDPRETSLERRKREDPLKLMAETREHRRKLQENNWMEFQQAKKDIQNEITEIDGQDIED